MGAKQPTQEQIDRANRDGYMLEPSRPCPQCGQPMFWYEAWNRYLCASWLVMEGGCKTW